MSEITQERWTYGCSLTVENPAVGKFINKGLYTGIELNELQNNWLICSVPAPSPLDGWKVKTVMIVYNIRNTQGPFGKIDKIGVKDSFLDPPLASFENLNLVKNPSWEIKRFDFPTQKTYKMGLGVSIHVDYPQVVDHGQWPTQFLFTSIGLGFAKSGDGPVIDPNP
jgi:hypothetical protein